MLPTSGMCLLASDCVDVFEGLIDLFIQVFTICYEQERPVTFQLIMHLLDKEDHRVTFTTALCMPENAQFIIIHTALLQHLDSIVYAQVLMIASNDLFQAPALIAKERKVLDKVQ